MSNDIINQLNAKKTNAAKEIKPRTIPTNTATDAKPAKVRKVYDSALRITNETHKSFNALKQITKHTNANELVTDLIESKVATLDENQRALYETLKKI